MRLFEELFGDADDGLSGARCVWKIGGEGYFEGVKGLTEFTDTEIRVYTAKGETRIQGEKLCVKKYADGDLYIGGKIYALSLPTGEGKEC